MLKNERLLLVGQASLIQMHNAKTTSMHSGPLLVALVVVDFYVWVKDNVAEKAVSLSKIPSTL